jgi:hypothetical protein
LHQWIGINDGLKEVFVEEFPAERELLQVLDVEVHQSRRELRSGATQTLVAAQ